MADELISRQAAIKLLRGECVAKYPSSFCFGLSAAADELSKLPTVDAVGVVRCAQCIYSNSCEIEGMLLGDGIENPYCAGGERREENATD